MLNSVKKFVRWFLLAIVLAYLVGGLGITESRIVTPLTFGLLDKPAAFRIHTSPVWLILFLVFLVLHIVLSLATKRRQKQSNDKTNIQN
jgi:thiosulfate reductase cytochrome b subunit